MHSSWLARFGLCSAQALDRNEASHLLSSGAESLSPASSTQIVRADADAADHSSVQGSPLRCDSLEPSHSPPKKPKLGRPFGTFGGSMARAAMRQVAATAVASSHSSQAVVPSTAASGPGGGVLEHFRFINVGSPLQRQLYLFARQQHSEPALLSENSAEQFLFQGRRPVASLASIADASSRTVQSVGQDSERVAATVLECSAYLWSTLFARAQMLIDEQGWKGILFGRARKYDETPHRIRLLEATDGAATDLRADGLGVQASSEGSAAKILQSRLAVFMLLHHPASAKYLMLAGHVPCPLQTMDATTAENIKASQLRVEKLTVGAEALAQRFTMRVTLACSDRAGSNLAAERSIRQDAEMAGASTVLVHTPCDVHKLGTCQKSVLSLVSSHISGMVNVGLATRLAGSTATLRAHLLAIFSERLEVSVGPPQYEDYRKEVYDLLLEDLCTVYSAEDKHRRAKTPLRRKQRAILSRYLNGNLEDERIVHWAEAPVSREAVLKEFERFVVPALVPGPCPVLNRSKFLAFESTAAWVALLTVHHNIFAPLMQRFHGKEEQAVPLAPLVLGRPSPDSAWFDMGLRRSSTAASTREDNLSRLLGVFGVQQLDRDEDSNMPEASAGEPALEQAQTSGELSWADLNKASRRKVAMYGQSKPGSTILVLLAMVKPVLRLLVQFISLSSQKYDDTQDARALQGEPREYRVVQVAEGYQVKRFHEDVQVLMNRPLTVLPAASHTFAVRGLMFRMLSRAAGSVHQLLEISHQGCPYRVFKALSGGAFEVSNIPECLWDPLTQSILSRYPSYDELLTEEAQQLLSSIAHWLSLDILDIEARHSSARRLITMRSVQTWRMSMRRLNSEWILRQVVIMREPWTPVQQELTSRRTRRKKATSSSVQKDGSLTKKKRGRKGGGGPWRAYMHLFCKGQKPGGPLLAIKARYHLLKANSCSEWRAMEHLGFLATLAHRHGEHSFLQPPKGSKKPQELALVGASGAERMQAEIAELKSASRAEAAQQRQEESQRQELVRHASARMAASIGSNQTTSCMKGVLQSNCFRCLPGHAGQPAVANFCAPADMLVKDFCRNAAVLLRPVCYRCLVYLVDWSDW